MLVGVLPALTAQQRVAATPPMGWNSWDSYGLTITEAQFRENVGVLREKLLPSGYRYAVIDEGWFFENPDARPTPDKLHYALDSHGRYVPTPLRFPSAGSTQPQIARLDRKFLVTTEETSFTELGRWVHAQGLFFGIHIVRGIPRASVERNFPIEAAAGSPETFHAHDAADTTDACPWDPTNWGVKDNAAGQAWYDSLLRQYAAWGIDLLKVDCISDHPYKAAEIRMIRRAIDKSGRPIVLSLSPGPTQLEHAAEVASLANMWRISDDIWDLWEAHAGFPQSVKSQFDRTAAWASHARPGNWPDADMLPLGELRPAPGWGKPRSTSLTLDEQRTLMTLWAMARSPLIIGTNLTLLDAPTLALLTQPAVLRIDQHATSSKEMMREGDLIFWQAKLAGGHHAVAIFNTGDTPAMADGALNKLKDEYTHKLHLTDAWTGNKLGKLSEIPPHGCILLTSWTAH